MAQKGIISFIYLVAFLVSQSPYVNAEDLIQLPWKLPFDISDSNTVVKFEVDSTWHTVEGRTSNLHGSCWLGSPNDPTSIQASIIFPVKAFDTDGESRDERMREVMQSEQFPLVELKIDSMSSTCSLAEYHSKKCSLELQSTLKIRDIKKSLTLPAEIERSNDSFLLKGSIQFNWTDFGVEDPSILIAKLDPAVTVSYAVTIPTP